MAKIIPVFRVFDYDKTIQFYIDWLGFIINWEHRPHGHPFYMQVSIRGVALDLSEHHGECSPGGRVSISEFTGLAAYYAQLKSKNYIYMNPGLERVEWQADTIEMTVIDPFYNKLIFSEQIEI